jgi:hypothetical protein
LLDAVENAVLVSKTSANTARITIQIDRPMVSVALVCKLSGGYSSSARIFLEK